MTALFESYNARFSDLRTIGSTFVLRQKEFDEICGPENTLVLGPRGSGKTTLLKMMKIGAQIASNSTSSFRTLKNIKYRPVYLHADRLFEALTKGIDSNRKAYSPFLSSMARTLTSIRTRFSFIDTFDEITDERTQNTPVVSHHYLTLDRHKEAELCRLLTRAWNIDDDIINLKEMRACLSGQISRLNAILDRSMLVEGGEAAHFDFSEIFSDPISSAVAFIDCFDSVFPQKRGQWALCVDELEIMPPDLQQYFFLNLRSTDQRLLIKLATSPFTAAFSIFDESSPMDSNDYISVNLSDARKRESVKFTRRLVAEIVKREGLSGSTTVQAILGKSPVTEDNADQGGRGGPYSPPRGAHYQRFKKLAEIDDEFRIYLARNEVDIDSLDSLTESSRAAKARQAIWQVALRLEFGANQAFRTSTTGKMRRSPRKRIASLYTGADSVLAMCEGNPRITIGLFRSIVREYKDNGRRQINPAKQSALIELTIAKYLSLLSAIPVRILNREWSNASIVTVLERIGEVCARENLVGKFAPEPLSSFIVTDDLAEDVIEALGAAINQGAFVMIEDRDKRLSYGRLQGARLRLSYLLCPRYRLPLTFGRALPLRRVLDAPVSAKADTMRMNDLFEYYDQL
ncbi:MULTISPECIES: hypothetical protein [unclassified Mesorhizobium]|uniref:ORC-CDC6 family AAA ATPase n=1 Tax=unclassified Mesorhizobium TaxID=325217 RepID=UPI00112E4E54|nr:MULTISPECIES: hypothetical protein [unclassified Mesorhizobium]MCA0060122.1 hypothetical protein [Mesorhizobium sp. B261B1A]TPL10365.1 hypothetical protein FJ944_12060 [Mesorhizobium sp. B2-4-11]